MDDQKSSLREQEAPSSFASRSRDDFHLGTRWSNSSDLDMSSARDIQTGSVSGTGFVSFSDYVSGSGFASEEEFATNTGFMSGTGLVSNTSYASSANFKSGSSSGLVSTRASSSTDSGSALNSGINSNLDSNSGSNIHSHSDLGTCSAPSSGSYTGIRSGLRPRLEWGQHAGMRRGARPGSCQAFRSGRRSHDPLRYIRRSGTSMRPDRVGYHGVMRAYCSQWFGVNRTSRRHPYEETVPPDTLAVLMMYSVVKYTNLEPVKEEDEVDDNELPMNSAKPVPCTSNYSTTEVVDTVPRILQQGVPQGHGEVPRSNEQRMSQMIPQFTPSPIGPRAMFPPSTSRVEIIPPSEPQPSIMVQDLPPITELSTIRETDKNVTGEIFDNNGNLTSTPMEESNNSTEDDISKRMRELYIKNRYPLTR